MRTWAEWDDVTPGFIEIDLVGHQGGNATGEFYFTLTATDIATGWTVNRYVKNKAAIWAFEALEHVIARFPFPILGIDSDYADSRIMSTFAEPTCSAVVNAVALSALCRRRHNADYADVHVMPMSPRTPSVVGVGGLARSA